MDKYQLSERDICIKFITPAIQQAGWQQHQFREEVNLTDGRVMVRGKLAARVKNPDAKGGPKRADFVLYARSNVPIAVVEAKQADHLLCNPAATSRNEANAASKCSMISCCKTSGGGRSSRLSRLSSLSQKMSRLALSRAIKSS